MTAPPPTDGLEHVGDANGRPVYYDDRRGTYHTWYDEDSEPITTALLMTVSSVLDVEPTDLDVLYDCVDPDALDALFGHWQGHDPCVGAGSISFRFTNCAVTIRGDGEIVIDPHPERTAVA